MAESTWPTELQVEIRVYIDTPIEKVKINNLYPTARPIVVHCTANFQPLVGNSFFPLDIAPGKSEVCLCGVDFKLNNLSLCLPDDEIVHYCISKDDKNIYITLSEGDGQNCRARTSGRHCYHDIDGKYKKIEIRYPVASTGAMTMGNTCKC